MEDYTILQEALNREVERNCEMQKQVAGLIRDFAAASTTLDGIKAIIDRRPEQLRNINEQIIAKYLESWEATL